MLDDDFKKSATKKITTMSANEYKEAFKAIGSKLQTNEEWFNGLPTEEKAEWLDKVAENCCQICDRENRELCRKNIAIGCKFENAEKWEAWLKQPHREERKK